MNLLSSLRKGENFHIVLWLVKDMCWVMDQKLLGTIMVAPTLLMAIWIAYRSREDMGELLHSLAVVFWITANGTWMVGEFYFKDGTRGLAIPFFIAGLVCVAIYYLVLAPREASLKRRDVHDRTA
jgi:Na+/proline symporter